MLDPMLQGEWSEILPSLIAATAMGAIIGIDRDMHHKPAGIRVLALVCLSSAAIILASKLVTKTPSHLLVSDGVLRTVQGVLSGIGFLGAGVILRGVREQQIIGITTAAAVWMASILGMLCGLGLWKLTITLFVLGMITMISGRKIEKYFERIRPKKSKIIKETIEGDTEI